jgi:ribulose bisphosphate carboxylase small subunit
VWQTVQIPKLLKQGWILLWRTKGEYARLIGVDEGRKRVLLIAACILAARKLSQWDGRNSPASESTMFDAIALAERIMAKIDSRWPVR